MTPPEKVPKEVFVHFNGGTPFVWGKRCGEKNCEVVRYVLPVSPPSAKQERLEKAVLKQALYIYNHALMMNTRLDKACEKLAEFLAERRSTARARKGGR